MLPRSLGNSFVLFLLSAAGLGPRMVPQPIPLLFALAKDDTGKEGNLFHDERPHLRQDFARRRPNKRPGKRPNGDGGRDKNDGKDKKKDNGKKKDNAGKKGNGKKGKKKDKNKRSKNIDKDKNKDKNKPSKNNVGKDKPPKNNADKGEEKPPKNNADKDNDKPSKNDSGKDKEKLPVHKLIGYWHNFVNGAGCPIRLLDMSDAWDVIDIAFADNDRESDGTVHFNLFSGDDRCPGLDPAEFKGDMAALQARGKVFVLSLGGAEGAITLNTDRDEANLIESLVDIVEEWGFDGLDVDLESGSGIVVGSEIQKRLGPALLRVEEELGRDMYLTMAPEHPYVHGAYVAYAGPWGAYLPVIDATRSTLDLLHVQLYNNGGLTGPCTGGEVRAGTVDMMVASARMLVEGFDTADGGRFAPLRDDQVAIGLPSGPAAAFMGQAPTGNILDALNCLTRGVNCGTVRPSFNYENFGGVMTWSINWDRHDGYIFSGPVGDKLKQMNSQ